MGIIDINEHLRCFNYDRSDRPVIETAKIVKKSVGNAALNCNEIIFIVEGRVRFASQNYPQYEGYKGQVLFLPAASNYSYEALADATIVVFRINNPVVLCKCLPLEKLYNTSQQSRDGYNPQTKSIGKLEMNARMWHFLDGVADCLTDGLRCHYWMEMKVNELFILLRVYYDKEDISDFFFLILSNNLAFSEQVRLHWKRFQTANQLAEFLNYSPKQFAARFTAVFGQTPYRWIMQSRARIVYTEIISTGKQFKQIAIENGFASDSAFTRFCKNELGKTPSQIREEKNINKPNKD